MMIVESVAEGGDGDDGIRLVPGRDRAAMVTLQASPAQLTLGFAAAAASLVLVDLVLQTIRFIIDDPKLGGLLSSFSWDPTRASLRTIRRWQSSSARFLPSPSERVRAAHLTPSHGSGSR